MKLILLFILSACIAFDCISQTFTINEEEVTLSSPVMDVHGTFTYPEELQNFTCVLIIAGSGPTDRNGNSAVLPGKNNSLKMLAESLAEKGIASLRYDKRGVGESRSVAFSEAAIRFEDYIHDAVEWVKKLTSNDNISNVGIIGHSEGSLIGMIAARRSETGFFISINGAGTRADSIIIEQLTNQPLEIQIQASEILSSLADGILVDSVPANLTSLFRPTVQPYLISWFQYDPQTEISKLKIPILIVQGKSDLQADTANAYRLHSHSSNADMVLIDSMNHVLKITGNDVAKNLNAYSNPELPVSDELIGNISQFIKGIVPSF